MMKQLKVIGINKLYPKSFRGKQYLCVVIGKSLESESLLLKYKGENMFLNEFWKSAIAYELVKKDGHPACVGFFEWNGMKVNAYGEPML